ncbi:hypothetical protein ADINL_2558 [Nitrincola lacisaponensis]|uniref:Uncharacterized protein n=1 Tax=Nitrincola lacisaponensis TaxID=267850 RepID=A0A063Y172_9GAMM|nr:hypothetical protein ADINL_2558 [Nitrincola lacisaponensis]
MKIQSTQRGASSCNIHVVSSSTQAASVLRAACQAFSLTHSLSDLKVVGLAASDLSSLTALP